MEAPLIFGIVVLIFSVIIHEVAHGWAAYALGDPTAKLANRLTLNPVRHVDLLGTIIIPGLLLLSNSSFLFGWAKPVPYNPYNLRNARWGEAIVSIAGVLTNLVIALIFALVARYATSVGAFGFASLAEVVVWINLLLGIFNLLPIPPLDGYTFLRSVMPIRRSMAFREFEDRLRSGGFMTLIVFLVVFSLFLARPFMLLVDYIFRIFVGG
ncbi:MAG TPA: site-2 protease family protein [Candidatus Paceibacterota bacterium]|jgi:Zn-dependent protease